jgi:glyoxylase-like metal-dependent hydrolase (beta-lactamase superfamily II)
VDDAFELTRLITEPLENNVFIVRCTQTHESVLVDAAGEPDRIVPLATQKNVKRVLTTHGHWDHIGAIPNMREAGIAVGIGAGDEARVPQFDFVIRDGDIYEIGNLRFEAISTPGHTNGSTCFYLHNTNLLFTGDTLFPNGPGATHFPGGDFSKIMRSIRTRLYDRFADDIVVWPGHGEPTTIGIEKPHFDDWLVKYGPFA